MEAATQTEEPAPAFCYRLPLWRDFDFAGKQVLVREDFNVPLIDSGSIRDDTRLQSSLPGLREIIATGASVRVISHLGRPGSGDPDERFSLLPVAHWLSDKLGTEVPLLTGNWTESTAPAAGSMAICENIRFIPGETANSMELSKALGGMCDFYINDAFAVSHREHASVCGVVAAAPQSCIGPLMYREIENLGRIMEQPARPLVAVIGGAKLQSKMGVMRSLLPMVDSLIVGGGIANTLLACKGYEVGKSVDQVSAEVMELGCELLSGEFASRLVLPGDVVCAATVAPGAASCVRALNEIDSDHIILDIGPDSRSSFDKILRTAGTIVWSGPPGFFELEGFSAGTESIVNSVASSNAFSVAGGGDTLAAISAFGGQDGISYLSTGGGAFLSFLEKGSLPALEAMARVMNQGAAAVGRN